MMDNNELNAIQAAIQAKENKQRYIDNPDQFSEEQLKILDENQEYVPFAFNRGQRKVYDLLQKQLKEEGRIRAICLKARRVGISSAVASLYFNKSLFNENQRALIVAHDKETAEELFDKTKDFITHGVSVNQHVLDGVKPARKGTKFNNGSSYSVLTAGSDEVGRGKSSNLLHLSEAAFWSRGHTTIRGLLQSVSKKAGSSVIFESTPNGPQGVFFDMWNAAVEGESPYIPIFLPWFEHEDYKLTPPDGWSVPNEDLELQKRYSLTNAQVYWRRREGIPGAGGLDGFRQEYPASPEEAFYASGESIFDPVLLDKIECRTPLSKEIFNFETGAFTQTALVGDDHLHIFKRQEQSEKYVIGADVAQGGQGENSDYSTAVVISSANEIVATFKARKIPPQQFAVVLRALGFRYNSCMIAPENNSIGLGTVEELTRLGYPNLYYKDTKTYATEENVAGFRTTQSTRPAIIGELQSAIFENELTIPCVRLVEEMKVFIENKSGKAEAASGKHDDLVMATCIAWSVMNARRQQLTAGTNWGDVYRKHGITTDFSSSGGNDNWM